MKFSRYEGMSALHLAATLKSREAQDHAGICRLLLADPRTEVNAKSAGGYNALHFAVAQRQMNACLVLLQCGEFDANATDKAGIDALQLSIWCSIGFLAMVCYAMVG